MSTYKVDLWNGFGIGYESYIVQGYDEQEVLDVLANRLRGSSYVITYEQYKDKVLEEMEIGGSSKEEAEQIVSESWLPCNEGLCLFVMNMQIAKVPDAKGRAPRFAVSNSRKPKGLFGRC